MFGVRPTLEVNGKRKYKSCWGACISLVAIIIILIFAFFQILEAQKYSLAGQEFIAGVLGDDPSMFYHKYDPKLMAELEAYNSAAFMAASASGTAGASIELPQLSEELKDLQEDLLAHETGARLVRNHLFQALDAAALVGGFVYFIQIVFSTLVKCFNRKLYVKHVLTESYLLQKDEGYLCVPPGYLAKHNRKQGKGSSSGHGSLKKEKTPHENPGKRSTSAPGTSRTPNLERIPEEDGEVGSYYEDRS